MSTEAARPRGGVAVGLLGSLVGLWLLRRRR